MLIAETLALAHISRSNSAQPVVFMASRVETNNGTDIAATRKRGTLETSLHSLGDSWQRLVSLHGSISSGY